MSKCQRTLCGQAFGETIIGLLSIVSFPAGNDNVFGVELMLSGIPNSFGRLLGRDFYECHCCLDYINEWTNFHSVESHYASAVEEDLPKRKGALP
jgi:hypothetical protein